MTKEQIKKIYMSAAKTVYLLDNKKEMQNLTPSEIKVLYDKANNILIKYEQDYYNILLDENEQLKQISEENNEAKEVLKIIPLESFENRKQLTNLITNNSERLQNELTYIPELFYDKYLLTVTQGINETDRKNLLQDIRFKEWFGNSQVIDKDGNPLLVYHGSGGDVNEFTNFKFDTFPGNYFAENKSYAEWFSRYRGGNSFIFRCYLRVQNPIDLTIFKTDLITYEDFIYYVEYTYGYKLPFNKMLKAMSDKTGGVWAWRYLRNGVDWLKYIQSKNEFDGFHYYENNPDDLINEKENITKAWLVLNGNQIKAADTRNRTYSLFTNDIRMKKGGLL